MSGVREAIGHQQTADYQRDEVWRHPHSVWLYPPPGAVIGNGACKEG
jgi:hypothetical protein